MQGGFDLGQGPTTITVVETLVRWAVTDAADHRAWAGAPAGGGTAKPVRKSDPPNATFNHRSLKLGCPDNFAGECERRSDERGSGGEAKPVARRRSTALSGVSVINPP